MSRSELSVGMRVRLHPDPEPQDYIDRATWSQIQTEIGTVQGRRDARTVYVRWPSRAFTPGELWHRNETLQQVCDPLWMIEESF